MGKTGKWTLEEGETGTRIFFHPPADGSEGRRKNTERSIWNEIVNAGIKLFVLIALTEQSKSVGSLPTQREPTHCFHAPIIYFSWTKTLWWPSSPPPPLQHSRCFSSRSAVRPISRKRNCWMDKSGVDGRFFPKLSRELVHTFFYCFGVFSIAPFFYFPLSLSPTDDLCRGFI